MAAVEGTTVVDGFIVGQKPSSETTMIVHQFHKNTVMSNILKKTQIFNTRYILHTSGYVSLVLVFGVQTQNIEKLVCRVDLKRRIEMRNLISVKIRVQWRILTGVAYHLT